MKRFSTAVLILMGAGLIPAPVSAGGQSSGPDSSEEIGRVAQRELARLGCFTGDIGESWGREGRAAVKRFNQASQFALPDWPDAGLIDSLRNYPDGYCQQCRGDACTATVKATEPPAAPRPAPPPAEARKEPPPAPAAVTREQEVIRAAKTDQQEPAPAVTGKTSAPPQTVPAAVPAEKPAGWNTSKADPQETPPPVSEKPVPDDQPVSKPAVSPPAKKPATPAPAPQPKRPEPPRQAVRAEPEPSRREEPPPAPPPEQTRRPSGNGWSRGWPGDGPANGVGR
jgi:hypothetical protein